MTMLTTDSLGFDAALGSVQPGGTIQVAGGLDHAVIKGRSFDPPVTLDLTQATVTSLRLDRVDGVTIRGGDFHAKPGDWLGALYVSASKNVHVSKIEADGGGVMFKDSSDVSLEVSIIENCHSCVALVGVERFVVQGNSFLRFSSDGVDVYSSRKGFVGYNVFAARRNLGDGAHADAVQLANTVAGSLPTADVEVAFNLAHGDLQGFTAFGPAIGYDRVDFHDNTIVGGQPQGVALYGGRDSTVANNHAWSFPWAQYRTSVNTIGCTNLTRYGNTVGAWGVRPAVSDPVGK